MTKKTVAIASDHAGYDLKESLCEELEKLGFEPINLGTYSKDSVDYPDFANNLAECIDSGKADTGVLVCGSGIGISIAANRHKHIRAALVHSITEAKLSRMHNNANVVVFGERIIGEQVAFDCLRAFLETEFEGGRHERRVAKMG